MSKWYALFSQTGSELTTICRALNRTPDVILTNNPEGPVCIEGRAVQYMHDEALQRWLANNLEDDCLVTLHGYLRILRPSVLDRCDNIYNGHPGLINIYPELKGKDPQQRVIDSRDKYRYVGSVIHRVTEEVDGGEIVSYAAEALYEHTDVFRTNSKLSINLWLEFMRGVLYG